MAPVNGTPGKPAKPAVRPLYRPVVPVIPLNYPQRPASKQTTAPSAPSSSSNKAQIATQPVEEKTVAHVPKEGGDQVNGNATGHGPSSNSDLDAATSSAPPAQATTRPEPAGPVETLGECDNNTPTVSSAVPDRRVLSPTRHRPPGLPNPAPEPMGTSGRAPEGPIIAPHPAAPMNRSGFHHPHPSNGSMGFNGFHDSNTSSPAPRSGGGFAPPPGLLPYPPPMDGYGRALVVSAIDGYPPKLINHHAPPTPHSFHGSQSSMQAEEHAFNHYPVANGSGARPPATAGQGTMPPPGMTAPMPGAGNPTPGSMPDYQALRDQDEALSFLRHGVSDNTFHDCMLEVHFPDSPEYQDHPGYRQLHRVLRTNGHRFILSRSPVLAGVMKSQGTALGGVILLEANDEYMRSDIFWYSLRSLYGWSFADGILPTELRLRDAVDDLKTALGYIATARYLQLPWVHSAAVHRASSLLLWSTIELAVKFVSRVTAISPRNDGFNVSALLEQVLAFIIHNFPASFTLDVNAGDYGFPRFPPSSPLVRNPNAPTIANGTSGGLHSRQSSTSQTQMPRNPRVSSNLRLSQIKFGDISPSKNGYSPPRAPTPNETILSRILLNLPFEPLKQILEHPHLAKSSGEFTPASRQSMINDVIVERELRRQRILEKVDPLLRVYQERVENATGPLVVGHMDDFWVNNMGFKEEVFPGDLPYLVHTWSQPTSSSVST
ncbi:hypothetical protein F5144DRAFT_385810 [Chaetomium tenue]|uniref:Uncharacterized protein n=1 Tax=Chaetomium tenue TaxID=1854479 RepID=A0ACB7NUV6_9PEZI|nr:hypothetical protein F5144DRAFT_385810 [Chaetomium globosum]